MQDEHNVSYQLVCIPSARLMWGCLTSSSVIQKNDRRQEEEEEEESLLKSFTFIKSSIQRGKKKIRKGFAYLFINFLDFSSCLHVPIL